MTVQYSNGRPAELRDPIVTHDLLERMEPSHHAWNRKQLAYLGVPWPPLKGWKKLIVGRPREPLRDYTLQGPDRTPQCMFDFATQPLALTAE